MKIPECDLLLLGGDICPVDQSHEIHHQRHWLRTVFADWLEDQQQVKDVLWIAGNHDFGCEGPGFYRIAQEIADDVKGRGGPTVQYLQDSMADIDGVKVWGSPWVPNLPSWAFHRLDVKFLDQMETMPWADIYLLHGPPMGILDALNPDIDTSLHEHVGAPYIERAIVKHEIPQVICGHIHESYGLIDRGPTRYRNVAHMDGMYNPVNRPHVFHYERPGIDLAQNA